MSHTAGGKPRIPSCMPMSGMWVALSDDENARNSPAKTFTMHII